MRAMARRDPLRPQRPPCWAPCRRWRAWPPPASLVYSHVINTKEVLLFVVVVARGTKALVHCVA